jgi:hypothetical protein
VFLFSFPNLGKLKQEREHFQVWVIRPPGGSKGFLLWPADRPWLHAQSFFLPRLLLGAVRAGLGKRSIDASAAWEQQTGECDEFIFSCTYVRFGGRYWG